jgi:trehalose utilization protein
MHEAIAAGLRERLGTDAEVRTATLDQADHGLSEEVLAQTDVLTWWGHAAHEQVSDDIAAKVHARVLAGMGLLVLHSAHYSKIFIRLMGTTCSLRWREAGERELVWTVNPGHPIVEGVPEVFSIPHQETYSEYFDIPQPDELVFISSFAGGEVFRSGCCFMRGLGLIFYFSPGHETHPVYHQGEVQQILANAIRWAAPRARKRSEPHTAIHSPAGWFE